MKVLVTCPPMLGTQEQFVPIFEDKNIEVHCPRVVQVMSEEELIELVPQFDGWIIGDDPATSKVFEAGHAGNLKAAVKWGIGVDNVDFEACKSLGIGIINTPDMFGPEVADIAVAFVIGLARHTNFIDREVRKGNWPKPAGISLSGKTVGLIGHGDIGKSTATRLIAAGMNIIAYDPGCSAGSVKDIPSFELESWPNRLGECDFLVFTCSLNDKSRHMLNKSTLSQCKEGVRVVNVARGSLIDEKALVNALQSGKVHSVALDVFEEEPLPMSSALHDMPMCIFGSHNGSNTIDAVHKTNIRAINELFRLLDL